MCEKNKQQTVTCLYFTVLLREQYLKMTETQGNWVTLFIFLKYILNKFIKYPIQEKGSLLLILVQK
jgi:hypothetical protein